MAGTNGHEVERGTDVFAIAFFADFDLLAAFFAARASSAAFTAAESWSFFDRASAVAARLLGPRMGSLGVNIQPTRDRLPTDQSPFVEEPRVLSVEFLERIIGEDHGVGPFGDA